MFRFDMDCNDGSCTGLFYTRRIGRPPQLDPDDPEDGFVSSPVNTTIIGATKVAGRVGGFSVGILNALTAEEEAQIAVGTAALHVSDRAVRELHGRPRAQGVREPVVARFDDDGDEPQSRRRCEPAAAVLERGLRRRPGLGLALLEEPVQRSRATGPEARCAAARRRSRGCRRTTSTATSGRTRIMSSSTRRGHRWPARPASSPRGKSPANGSASNRTSGSRLPASTATTSVSSAAPTRSIRATGCSGGTTSRASTSAVTGSTSTSGAAHNFDGDRLFLGGNINMHWTWQNNWSNGFGINHETTGFDDRATRGGPGALYEGNWNFWGYFDTDNRKPLIAQPVLGRRDVAGVRRPLLRFQPVGHVPSHVRPVDQRRDPLQPLRPGRAMGREPWTAPMA